MSGVTYTLVADGPSDRLLEFPIKWVLRNLGVRVEHGQWADLSRISPRPKTLEERAQSALQLYPAQVLLVHRDAEGEALKTRIEEIRAALRAVTDRYVAVVPVRMTEAWLLHDEAAIRRASGNPHGTNALRLPAVSKLERVSNPKAVLLNALLTASGLSGRKRRRCENNFGQMRYRTAELIDDYSPLLTLEGFSTFRRSLQVELNRLAPRPRAP